MERSKVVSKFFDYGKIDVSLSKAFSGEKNFFISYPEYDFYVDIFEDFVAARNFICKLMKDAGGNIEWTIPNKRWEG